MCPLAIMARYPTVGQVKTRLARTIGAERAAALYRAFLCDLDGRFGRGPRPVVWMFHPPEAPFADVVAPGAYCLPQRGGDLGERLLNAFRDLTGTTAVGLVVMGADVPHIPADRVEEAAHALVHADVVLGPTDDGGYYLVAMRVPHDVFSGVDMGTARVLAQTQARVAALGLRLHVLAPWFDIDAAADLERLRALLRRDAALAAAMVHTGRVLGIRD